MAVAVAPAMGSESDTFVKSSLAATVRMAGVAPVLTLAVAPAFPLGSLELSFRVNREEGSIITLMVTWAVLVAASTKAGHVYPEMSIEIARIASLHFTSSHIGRSMGLATWNKGQKGFPLKR
jgi:hypothetical protein